MAESEQTTQFRRIADIEPEKPTLIEGLPGHGLVASIAVDQITDQLELEHYGSITSDTFPPVATFEDALVQDLVRVYAGNEPPVMTLLSDLALPPSAVGALSGCVLDDLARNFARGIFLAGAPAESEEQLGDVRGVATTEGMREELEAAEVPIAEENGVVGGVTGALVSECYQAEVPAILLIVRAHPRLPDPGAAVSVIEDALEPLVDFDIDTSELEERAEQIQQQMQQIARQYEQMSQREEQADAPVQGMYQ